MENKLMKALRTAGVGSVGLLVFGPTSNSAVIAEHHAFESAMNSGSTAAMEKFLESYPTGSFSERVLQLLHDQLSSDDGEIVLVAGKKGGSSSGTSSGGTSSGFSPGNSSFGHSSGSSSANSFGHSNGNSSGNPYH